MNISNKQVHALIEKVEAADEKGTPLHFNTVPADKCIISRDSFGKLLHDLENARGEISMLEHWRDIASDLAEELILTKAYNHPSEAGEDSALYKFHIAAIGEPGDDEPY